MPSLRARMAEPVPAGSAAAFRLVFGLLGMIGALRFFAYGWIEQLYIEPGYHFGYYGLAWLSPLPPELMRLPFLLMALSALALALGWRLRLSLSVYLLAFVYIELLDKTTYLNHYYWVSLTGLLMLVLPLDRGWRPGARGQSSDRGANHDVLPRWVIWLLRFQVGLVYFGAGLAKLEPDWLLRAMPLRIWLAARADLPLLGPLLAQPWIAWPASWAAAVFDLSLPFLLLWRRTRLPAWLAGLLFHGLTGLLFDIGVFPLLMIGGGLIFFPPDWPGRLVDRLRVTWRHGAEAVRLRPRPARGEVDAEGERGQGNPESLLEVEATTADVRSRGSSLPGRPLAAALLLYLLLMLVLPLRHWAYPGSVLWTEEGFRFSWRVMLIEKGGQLRYRVEDPSDGRRWTIRPEAGLSPLQARMMRTQPDMIQQYARHLATGFAARGRPAVRVYADAFVSLNGRPSRRLIDPEVDLAAQPFGLAPKPWILPGPSDLGWRGAMPGWQGFGINPVADRSNPR